jgi:hypothetical protein
MYTRKDENTMNSTLKLIKAIGSPFVHEECPEPFREEEIAALYTHAVKNRIPLLYLDALEKNKKLFDLKPTYCKQYSRYLKIFDTMARVSDFLSSLDVEHAIFKSIRPYPDASVDIDTLIFGSEKYERVLKSFSKASWNMLGYGPQSATFFDSEAQVGIDLYREVAVSWVIYLDKEKLERYVTRRILPNKKSVYAFQVEADLLAIIAHSIIKEQIFTLAEYYTFLLFLKEVKMKEIERFNGLVEINNMVELAKSFVTLTAVLHNEAFGCVPEKLEALLSALGRDGLEEKRIRQNAFETPHKYHFLTLLKCVKDKLKEEKTRKSMALQGFEMMNPHFMKTVFAGLVDHMIRETY